MGRIKIPDFPYAEAGFSFYKKALTRSNAVNPAGRTKPRPSQRVGDFFATLGAFSGQRDHRKAAVRGAFRCIWNGVTW
jgi:hypothetical protein